MSDNTTSKFLVVSAAYLGLGTDRPCDTPAA